MNFTPNRVQPEQIEDEASHHRLAPPEYQTPEYHAQVLEAIRAGRITYAPGWNKRPDHVETASAEDNDYAAPKLLIAFCCALAAAGISLWYLF